MIFFSKETASYGFHEPMRFFWYESHSLWDSWDFPTLQPYRVLFEKKAPIPHGNAEVKIRGMDWALIPWLWEPSLVVLGWLQDSYEIAPMEIW